VAVGLYPRFVDDEDRPARSTYLGNRRNRIKKSRIRRYTSDISQIR
jgi:hypothetical protein